MRPSFGMGSGGSGGGGGGGMMKTVHRAVRAGIGGGSASQEPYSHSAATTTRTTTTNRNQPINTTISLSSNVNSSSSCSSLNHPVPAPPSWAFSSSPTATEEFDWECIDGGDNVNGVLYDDHFVFGSAPSKDEVLHAVASLQEVLHPIIQNRRIYDDEIQKISSPATFCESGSELDWTEPSYELCNSTRTLHDPRCTRVYDAFHLLHTDPSVQRMVISLSSDKAVWDAVMHNEVVRELRESVNEDESISEGVDDDDSNPVTQVLRWMFVNTKEKAIEMLERIRKLVNEFVRPTSKDDDPKTKRDTFEGKLRSSFLISIMVLLIVVVSRARKC